MKILNVTDIHISGKNPICRLDNLPETQFKKLKEVVQISNKLKIPVICNGDLFEQPIIAYSVFTQTVEILSEAQYGVYLVIGNHDILYYNVDTLMSTALGAMLISVPNIKHIEEFNIDYSQNISFCDWNSDIVCRHNDSHILVAHKAVVSEQIIKATTWMNDKSDDYWKITDPLLRQYKLLLCGHYHKQYTFKSLGKTVINPGSLTRRRINNDELDHTPSIFIVDLDTYQYEMVNLKSARQNDMVLSASHLELNKVTKRIGLDIDNFIKSIKVNRSESKNFAEWILKKIKEFNPEIESVILEVLQDLDKKETK